MVAIILYLKIKNAIIKWIQCNVTFNQEHEERGSSRTITIQTMEKH